MVKYNVGDTVTYGAPGRHVTHTRRKGDEAVILHASSYDGNDQQLTVQFRDGFIHPTWGCFVQPLVRSGPW